MPEPVVETVDVARRFRAPAGGVLAVDSVSLRVEPGEVVAVVGPSGSGKSTLLHLIAGLDRPDSGSVRITGTDWEHVPLGQRARFRRQTLGFVPQGYALLSAATAAENVEVPLLLEGIEPKSRSERVAGALDGVGLAAETAKLPDELSSGQQQRVALARALILGPRIVLADEPTAALDSETAAQMTELLVAHGRRAGAAVVIVTHDLEVAAKADRSVHIRSGRVEQVVQP
jgi:putative ABC transport system ATP-binding protein